VAERAAGYAALGLHVDGTDVDAVADTFARAVEHARSGGGPVIVEATCHRFRGHFEGDPEAYRSREERQHVRETYDPLKLYRPRLEAAGVTAEEADTVVAEEKAAMKDLLGEVLEMPMPDPKDALAYRFVEEVRP
jgi:pyruvate dehydrogenase E1 component alpha subunit